jgi:hypothetical protein
MEPSEKLYLELEQLKSTLPEIEAQEARAIEDPELCGLVSRLSMARVVYEVNDPRVGALQKEVTTTVGTIRSGRKEYLKQLGRICKELRALTTPAIIQYTAELTDLGLKPKLDRKILSQHYDGLHKRTLLDVESNEKAIRKIHELVKKTIEQIRSMSLFPISEIQTAFIEARLAIEAINWSQTERSQVDEVDFYRGSPPQGAGSDYAGPLTSLPMPPPKLPEIQR